MNFSINMCRMIQSALGNVFYSIKCFSVCGAEVNIKSLLDTHEFNTPKAIFSIGDGKKSLGECGVSCGINGGEVSWLKRGNGLWMSTFSSNVIYSTSLQSSSNPVLPFCQWLLLCGFWEHKQICEWWNEGLFCNFLLEQMENDFNLSSFKAEMDLEILLRISYSRKGQRVVVQSDIDAVFAV